MAMPGFAADRSLYRAVRSMMLKWRDAGPALEMSAPKTGGGSGGGATKCKVTGGALAGESGTYSVDDDGVTWCDTPGGSTDCTPDASGHSRCKDARVSLGSSPFVRSGGGLLAL
jgi:hypothetical protein